MDKNSIKRVVERATGVKCDLQEQDKTLMVFTHAKAIGIGDFKRIQAKAEILALAVENGELVLILKARPQEGEQGSQGPTPTA